jgi:hypothetical protein
MKISGYPKGFSQIGYDFYLNNKNHCQNNVD